MAVKISCGLAGQPLAVQLLRQNSGSCSDAWTNWGALLIWFFPLPFPLRRFLRGFFPWVSWPHTLNKSCWHLIRAHPRNYAVHSYVALCQFNFYPCTDTRQYVCYFNVSLWCVAPRGEAEAVATSSSSWWWRWSRKLFFLKIIRSTVNVANSPE
jgi:hypothetical protein